MGKSGDKHCINTHNILIRDTHTHTHKTIKKNKDMVITKFRIAIAFKMK